MFPPERDMTEKRDGGKSAASLNDSFTTLKSDVIENLEAVFGVRVKITSRKTIFI
jgi:hypothetical protein